MALVGSLCLALPFVVTAAVGSAFPFGDILAVGQLFLLEIAIRVDHYPTSV